jgi:hypothetical protein
MEQLLNSLSALALLNDATKADALAREMRALLAQFIAPRGTIAANSVVQPSYGVGAYLSVSSLPLDLLGCVCAFLYVHEHVLLMSTCRLLQQQCSSPRTWHTVVFEPDRRIPANLRFSSSNALDRVVAGGSAVSSCRWKWSEVRQLEWSVDGYMVDEYYEAREARRMFALEELSGFVSLRHLKLDGVKIRGDLTPLTACRMLRVLDIRGVDVMDSSPLSVLTALQTLCLNDTHVFDISPLSKLTALQDLQLRGTLVEHFSSLSSFTRLRQLSLGRTQFRDTSCISTLTALQTLWICNTPVKDIRPLSVLTALQELYISNTQVKDVTSLSALVALQKLWLDDTQVEDVTSLSTLTALRELWLDDTQVEDVSSLSTLTALRELRLDCTRVADIEFVSSLTALRDLGLYSTQVGNITRYLRLGLTIHT